MFYADVVLQPGAALPLPDDHEDRGLYVVDGSLEISGEAYRAGHMLVFRTGDRITLKAGERGARVMLLGGETLNGPRYIWWNFVASSKEKIEEAKEAWAAGDWEKAASNFRLRIRRSSSRCLGEIEPRMATTSVTILKPSCLLGKILATLSCG